MRDHERSPLFFENSWHRRIEYKIDRLGHHLTRLLLTSPISGQIAPISPTSTATTPKPARWRSILKFGRPLLGWLAERLAPWLWAYILPVVVGAWALGRDGAMKLWQFFAAGWHWLAG